MRIKKYIDAVSTLTSQGKFHICLGLDRVKQVLDLLGNPQEKIKVIHVAGTNGKGSVCSILASILSEAGYMVGLYTSPHLIEYTERVKINGVEIEKGIFAEYVSDICDIADQNSIHLTEFEILTVLAYKYFYNQGVDIAIIETGLGGRFDATNVITGTLLSIITSISIDHKDRLGDSIEKIAFEKAGIIKKNTPVIVGTSNMGLSVILNKAIAIGAKAIIPSESVELLFENGINYALFKGVKYEFALLGLWQKENLELVLEAIAYLRSIGLFISDKSIIYGLKNVYWPARMQYIKEKNMLIDGAHNVDAATKLIKSLNYYFPATKKRWIYGSLDTKEYEKIINILFVPEDEIYIYEFENKNAVGIKDIKIKLKNDKFSIKLYKAENTLSFSEQKCLTIVSGSFYMIGDFLKKTSIIRQE